MLFNKDQHTSMVCEWWLRYPQLASVLMLSRNFREVADWLFALATNTTVDIRENGVIEYIDFVRGTQIKEARIFVFGVNNQAEQELRFEAFKQCFEQGYHVIEMPSLQLQYTKMSSTFYRDSLNQVKGLIETISQKGAESTNGHSETLTTELRTADTGNTGSHSAANGRASTTTELSTTNTAKSIHKPDSKAAKSADRLGNPATDIPATDATVTTEDGNIYAGVTNRKRSTRSKKKQTTSQHV